MELRYKIIATDACTSVRGDHYYSFVSLCILYDFTFPA